MIRNLKILFSVALALGAFGATAAGAHAADEFHCSVNPCRGTLKPDGAGKSAHQVWILENEATTESLSMTCEGMTGESEAVGNVFVELTLFNVAYQNCTANGAVGILVFMNGCDYKFGSAGGRADEAKVKLECPTGKKVEIKFGTCVISISGGFESSGVGYTTIGTSPTREVTITVNHAIIPASNITVSGTKAACLINHEQSLFATNTTGNVILTGETPAGVMADAWYE